VRDNCFALFGEKLFSLLLFTVEQFGTEP